MVAQEVRALALRSAEAAKEIKQLLDATSGKVAQGSSLVSETGEALNRIIARMAEIDDQVDQIAGTSQAQSSGLQQINTAVAAMDASIQNNTTIVEGSKSASLGLLSDARQLGQLVAAFEPTNVIAA